MNLFIFGIECPILINRAEIGNYEYQHELLHSSHYYNLLIVFMSVYYPLFLYVAVVVIQDLTADKGILGMMEPVSDCERNQDSFSNLSLITV